MAFLSPVSARFYIVRTARAQPVMFSVTAALSLLVIVSGLLFLEQWQQVSAVQQQFAEQKRVDTASLMPSHAERTSASSPIDLPLFSSARFVDTLNEVASDAQFSLDEVSYELDDNVSQPYLRYRTVLTLSAAYPAIRQFAADLSTRLQNVDLDAISCTRGDIGKVALTCDLSFSAFFRKGANG